MTKKELVIVIFVLSGLAIFSISTALAGGLRYATDVQSIAQQNNNGNDNQNGNGNDNPDGNDNDNDNGNDNSDGNDNDNDNGNDNSDGNDNDNDNGNDNSDDDDETKAYGELVSFPESLIGQWVIEGLTVTANSSTKFEQEDGAFAVGRCIEIEYDPATLIAFEIETEDAYKCNGSTFTNKAYGTVEVAPATGYGQWTVSGVIYLTTAGETELEDGAGSAAVGDCVEIKYYADQGVNRAVEIELENDDDDCSDSPSNDNDDDRDESKIYAAIVEFPASPFTGIWNIGGEQFEATASTEFEQEDGSFAIGQCVEAEFKIMNGAKILLEIETEDSYKCMQGAGNNASSSYGTIDMLPSSTNLTGDWVVSGINYAVDSSTILEEEYGLFAVGAYVEVYYIISDTMKVATKIETHVAPGSGSNNGVGEIDNYDPSDDWADWTIDGVTYKADPVIEVDDDLSTNNRRQVSSLIGQTVIFNSYQRNGVNYLTSVSVADQIFLPIIVR